MGGAKDYVSLNGGDLDTTMPVSDCKSKEIKHIYISSCGIQSEQFNSYVNRCLPGQRLSKYGPLLEIRTETKIINHLTDLQCTICNFRIPLKFHNKAVATCRKHAASHAELNVWECVCCSSEQNAADRFKCRSEMEICCHIKDKHSILDPKTLEASYEFVVADSDEPTIASYIEKCFPSFAKSMKPANCTKCSTKIQNVSCAALLKHVEQSHNNKSLVFKCSACKYESSNKSKIQSHAKLEHGLRGLKAVSVDKSVEGKWVSLVMLCFPDHIPFLLQKYPDEVAKFSGKRGENMDSSF